MKKAKIMLSIIAVVAVVGGGLAFKAAHGPLQTYYTCGAANTCVKTQIHANLLSVDNNGGTLPQLTTTATLVTDPQGVNCVAQGCVNPIFYSPNAQ